MPPEEPSTTAVPSWKELTEFIQKQTQNDRDLIDKWFKVAAKALGAIIAVFTVGIALLGWRTLHDVRETAKTTAEEVAKNVAQSVAPTSAKTAAERVAPEAATDAVKRLMQDPKIQKLVQDTASQLFKEGAYQKAVAQAVRVQMDAAIQTEPIGEYDVTINGSPHQRIRLEKRISK